MASRVGMEDFENDGLVVLNDRPVEAEQTIIVTGVARSGTSMVARLLDHVGLPMGERKDDTVFEDVDLVELLTSQDIDGVRALIAKRNAAYRRWGFKHPHLHVHDRSFVHNFRSPRLVITFRDPIAIAERNRIAEQFASIKDTLLLAAQDSAATVALALSLDLPVLLVSYEKAIRRPAVFITALLEFCGLGGAQHDLRDMVKLVEPGRVQYLQNARRQFSGYVDGVTDGRLIGWAKQLYHDTPVELGLFVNDELVTYFLADHYRPDLQSQFGGTGMHGYSVDVRALGIPTDLPIFVRVRDRSVELTNSGHSIDDWVRASR